MFVTIAFLTATGSIPLRAWYFFIYRQVRYTTTGHISATTNRTCMFFTQIEGHLGTGVTKFRGVLGGKKETNSVTQR
jgi:hypothetical protein